VLGAEPVALSKRRFECVVPRLSFVEERLAPHDALELVVGEVAVEPGLCVVRGPLGVRERGSVLLLVDALSLAEPKKEVDDDVRLDNRSVSF
jgi:hypothetical protein